MLNNLNENTINVLLTIDRRQKICLYIILTPLGYTLYLDILFYVIADDDFKKSICK